MAAGDRPSWPRNPSEERAKFEMSPLPRRRPRRAPNGGRHARGAALRVPAFPDQPVSRSRRAAGAQGKFWEMHDVLFDHQDDVDEASLVRYAEQLGFDTARFEAELGPSAGCASTPPQTFGAGGGPAVERQQGPGSIGYSLRELALVHEILKGPLVGRAQRVRARLAAR